MRILRNLKKALFKVFSLLFSVLAGGFLLLSLGTMGCMEVPACPGDPGDLPAPLQRPYNTCRPPTHQFDASSAVFLPVAANALSLREAEHKEFSEC